MPKLIFENEYDDETGKYLGQRLLTDLPQPEPDPDPQPGSSDWNSFIPRWRVGASGGLYATPGSGYIQGWYKKRVAMLQPMNDQVEEIELFIELMAINPGIPAGEGFEIEVPEEIRPASSEWARGGGGDLWILGGENSYSIAPKWTDRNNRPMRILILGSGWEWTTNVPKVITEKASLYFWMKYLK